MATKNYSTINPSDSQIANSLAEAIKKYNANIKSWLIAPKDSFNEINYKTLYQAKSALLSETNNGVLCFYNLVAQNVFGYTPEEIIGKKSLILVPENMREERSDLKDSVLSENKKTQVITYRLNDVGNIITIWAEVFPWSYYGELSIAAIVRKI